MLVEILFHIASVIIVVIDLPTQDLKKKLSVLIIKAIIIFLITLRKEVLLIKYTMW